MLRFRPLAGMAAFFRAHSRRAIATMIGGLLAAGMISFAAAGLIVQADADDAAPSLSTATIGGGSFSLEEANGRYLKLDRRSGAVSFCDAAAGSWRCSPVPDERAAYEDEIARLSRRITELQQQIDALEGRSAGDRGVPGALAAQRLWQAASEALGHFFGVVETVKRERQAAL